MQQLCARGVALYNFATGTESYHRSLQEALRAVNAVGPVDDWVICEVHCGALSRYVTEGCGRSNVCTLV